MTTRIAVAGALLALIASAAPARAQDGLSAAVLQLARNAPAGVVRPINGERFYGGVVCARIIDANASIDDFASSDRVSFTVVPRTAVSTPGVCPAAAGLQFVVPGTSDEVGTRSQFEAWANANARSLLNILFPGSLSSALLGTDAAHFYGQQLLLTTVLGADAVRRPSAAAGRVATAGLAEAEWFRRDDSPGAGTALQGAYDFTGSLSVQGRYANHSEDLRTHAVTLGVDFHPYIELNRAIAVWRVGAVARSGITYANAAAANAAPLPGGTTSGPATEPNFGSIDFGGGGWASAYKDFGRARLVGGGLLQGSDSHVPGAWLGDAFSDLVDVVNDRGMDLDFSWGGSVGYDLTERAVLLGKYLETDNVKSGIKADPLLPDLDLGKPASRTIILGAAYRTGALRFSGGYRRAGMGDFNANAIFFRGNVDW
jgi:hypothetical protein